MVQGWLNQFTNEEGMMGYESIEDYNTWSWLDRYPGSDDNGFSMLATYLCRAIRRSRSRYDSHGIKVRKG